MRVKIRVIYKYTVLLIAICDGTFTTIVPSPFMWLPPIEVLTCPPLTKTAQRHISIHGQKSRALAQSAPLCSLWETEVRQGGQTLTIRTSDIQRSEQFVIPPGHRAAESWRWCVPLLSPGAPASCPWPCRLSPSCASPGRTRTAGCRETGRSRGDACLKTSSAHHYTNHESGGRERPKARQHFATLTLSHQVSYGEFSLGKFGWGCI